MLWLIDSNPGIDYVNGQLQVTNYLSDSIADFDPVNRTLTLNLPWLRSTRSRYIKRS